MGKNNEWFEYYVCDNAYIYNLYNILLLSKKKFIKLTISNLYPIGFSRRQCYFKTMLTIDDVCSLVTKT